MINIRKSNDRGKSTLDWLNSFHTFSFADYHDPKFIRFGALRVINQDTVLPEGGFSRHSHNNMEIISYVISGELAHKDSMGNGSVIKPGEIQVMSAGTGVLHSEFNHSKTKDVDFLQIWIIPNQKNLTPSYQQRKIEKGNNELKLIGSKDGQENTVIINQDVDLYVCEMTSDNTLQYDLDGKRMAWLQLIKGSVELNGIEMKPGDGAAIQNEKTLKIFCGSNAEFLFFDLIQ